LLEIYGEFLDFLCGIFGFFYAEFLDFLCGIFGFMGNFRILKDFYDSNSSQTIDQLRSLTKIGAKMSNFKNSNSSQTCRAIPIKIINFPLPKLVTFPVTTK